MAMVESDARDEFEILGQKVHMEYSVAPQPLNAAGNGSSASTLDWVCTMCQAVNFSR